MIDFAALLNKTASEAERPKPMAVGSYTFNIAEHSFGESTQKKTPYVEFQCVPLTPGPDVDMELLNGVKDWQQKKMRLTFYLTEDAIFRLSEFLECLGLDLALRSYAELIPETTNLQFTGVVSQTVSEKNPEDVYANIDSTAAA